jgi:hypothetical protein
MPSCGPKCSASTTASTIGRGLPQKVYFENVGGAGGLVFCRCFAIASICLRAITVQFGRSMPNAARSQSSFPIFFEPPIVGITFEVGPYISEVVSGDCKMKPINNDRVKRSGKSRTIRSNRKVASWHKEIDALVSSVERAWVAAERMRAAVEDRDSEASDPKGR